MTHLLLHAAEFPPERWAAIWGASAGLLVYRVRHVPIWRRLFVDPAPADAAAQPDRPAIRPILTGGQLALSLTNTGPAAYFDDPRTVNRIQAGSRTRRLVEPLFIPAGETRTLDRLLAVPPDFAGPVRLDLPNVGFTGELSPGEMAQSPAPLDEAGARPRIPLDVKFGDDLHLAGYTLLSHDGPPGRVAGLRLYWAAAANPPPDSQSIVRLVDQFGQTIAAHATRPGPRRNRRSPSASIGLTITGCRWSTPYPPGNTA